MFGKIENWLGELCAAASTEDEENLDSFGFEMFDNLVPEEQCEQDEEDSKTNVISDTESRFNISRSSKDRVKRVNVKPAPNSAHTAPSEELDQENELNQRTNQRKRCVREYKPPALPVVENANNRSSEERTVEVWQKRDCFPSLHQSANFFDLKEFPLTKSINRYRRFPKAGQKYLEVNNPFLHRPPRKPHHNLLVPCNWTTEETSSLGPEPRPPQIPSKKSNANRRLFQKRHFKISGMQKTAKDKEELPLKRAFEDKLNKNNSEQQEKNEDTFSHSSVEIFETEKVLSHEFINKPYQYSHDICHDPCYIEEPQTNQPAECKVNICIINLGNEEEARELSPEQESNDKKKAFGKMSLLDLKLPTKPDKEVEEEVCFTDVEVLKHGDWC